MPYPQAPWTLQGFSIQTVHLLDVEKARPLIPPEFEIISVWPGKTLGGVYISSYVAGSVLQYNELIVVPGMVSYAGKFGAWVSHIYVDSAASVEGGRKIWGLPKELAEFSWTHGDRSRVNVTQGDKQLCSISYSDALVPLSTWWRQPLTGTSFSTLNTDLLLFKSDFEFRLKAASANLAVPSESPFASLDLGQPFLAAYAEDLGLVVHAPEVVGKIARTGEFSYG
ncbi:acetoacetate decarboxylase family protein [Microcoleus sp. FACHB-831]|uniref:acetoacetate decarboxylase family protein n=1 Tax=Microcoleus sp. FACHB-831 TaxID=2692827 RepID=UPI0016831780|nr:acetoacetate decarboxylase family protein [Microcoleus sp. FACHB-831]MBD1924465.1 acetoacetate decarboxylase family protein [Microcoleus sp. FACHB-831]